jgi:hypothetical protein
MASANVEMDLVDKSALNVKLCIGAIRKSRMDADLASATKWDLLLFNVTAKQANVTAKVTQWDTNVTCADQILLERHRNVRVVIHVTRTGSLLSMSWSRK